MAYQYTYTVYDSFPNRKVDVTLLTFEIDASSIVPTVEQVTLIKHINRPDACRIQFNNPLLSQEEAVLEGVIASHEGEAKREPQESTPPTPKTLWDHLTDNG